MTRQSNSCEAGGGAARSDGPVVVLAAMKQELDPLRRAVGERPNVRLVLTGVGPERAREAAARNLDGASLVVSVGCCGGLVPGASAGMMVVPERILLRDGDRAVPAPAPDATWGAWARDAADRMGMHCSSRPLLTVSEALLTPEEKAHWHRVSGAVAVDMESGEVARVAKEMGVPHLCLRVVLDSVEETLAPDHVMTADGRILPGKLLKAMLKPAEFARRVALRIKLDSVAVLPARIVAALVDELEGASCCRIS